MEKSADAFRTITEVAEDLVLPQHVLRFWETRFPQIRPLKRAGGRRYYRPTDVVLLRSIRRLLYDDGYTIKGVQRLLKEQGGRDLRLEPAASLASLFGGPRDGGVQAESPERGEEALVEASGSELPFPAEPMPDVEALREALACIEECERILSALRRPTG